MTLEEMQLEMSEEVSKLCEERAVSEEEIKQVIQHGETTEEKLYQPETDRYLAKLMMKEPTYYVDYSIKEGKYIVNAAYWHYSAFVAKDEVEEIPEEVTPMAEEDKPMVEKWHCFKCKEKMEEATIVVDYMDIKGGQVGIECPKCGAAYIPEQTVVGAMRNNEDELDAK